MVNMATVTILKRSNPKCTSTHPKDNSCEVSLQSNQKYFFLQKKKFPTGLYGNSLNYLSTSRPFCTSSCQASRSLDLWFLRTDADNFMCYRKKIIIIIVIKKNLVKTLSSNFVLKTK
jgi:hypothetical protein